MSRHIVGTEMSPRLGLMAACIGACFAATAIGSEPPTAVIDARLQAAWDAAGVVPAAPADDATFLRRLTLDLAGRVPTARELAEEVGSRQRAVGGRLRAVGNSESKVQRPPAKAGPKSEMIRRLLDGPEFPLHFAHVLDGIIQRQKAGDETFVAWLRKSLRDRRSWDGLFRAMLLGPWKSDEDRRASRFLAQRARDTDTLTTDATRVFFGVNISCAKCHDHPLVEDWKQRHYYGMKSFFARTYLADKNKGIVGEKTKGEVTYADALGAEQKAQPMFLTGLVVEEAGGSRQKAEGSTQKAEGSDPESVPSRRRQLVEAALEQRRFFSRSFVNHVWAVFFGRGLVDPVDQMHSANPPSVPGLLDDLSRDFTESGYDIRRLVEAIVTSRAYALDSRWPDAPSTQRQQVPPGSQGRGPLPDPGLFAVARLRPLTARQLAFSMVLVTGEGAFDAARDPEARTKAYLEIEKQARPLLAALDERAPDFQSSTTEALYLSNHPDVQKLFAPAGKNLVARLSQMDDVQQIVTTAFAEVLGRPPSEAERTRLAEFLRTAEDRPLRVRELAWALATSAEFRFVH